MLRWFCGSVTVGGIPNRLNHCVIFVIRTQFTHVAAGLRPVTPRDGGKSKAVAVQAWTGPEISRNLRLPDFKTFGT